MKNKKYFTANYEKYELSYYIVESKTEKNFGVGITSTSEDICKSSFYYNLFSDKKEAVKFLELLYNTVTFPTTLNDMVEDYMFETKAS